MSDNGLQTYTPNGGALSVEHYQTFEMAKENDDILGGDNIAQLLVYTASARAKAQAIHAAMAATKNLDEAVTLRADSIATEQAYARVSIFGDQRIGELLRELPTRQGARTDKTSVAVPTKVQAEREAGISHAVSIDLQTLAANPDVVQAVIDKAEAEGRLVSRKQVLDAINEKKRAEQQRDEALDELEEAYHSAELMEAEVASLRRQVAEKPQSEVVEREVVREVVPSDYEEVKRKVKSLQDEASRLNKEYRQMWTAKQEVERQLQQANELLGEKGRTDNAQRDIEQFAMAANTFLRQYAGRALAFDQFDRVDESTKAEFKKSITNLAAFAQNLLGMISEQ